MKTARIEVFVSIDEELDLPDIGMALNGGIFYWVYDKSDITDLYYINGYLSWPFQELQ
jgi:hypothetical protein